MFTSFCPSGLRRTGTAFGMLWDLCSGRALAAAWDFIPPSKLATRLRSGQPHLAWVAVKSVSKTVCWHALRGRFHYLFGLAKNDSELEGRKGDMDGSLPHRKLREVRQIAGRRDTKMTKIGSWQGSNQRYERERVASCAK